MKSFPEIANLIRGWPRCAVCNNLVDRVTATEDYMGDALVLTVECHGASEETRIPMSVFMVAREPATFGDAFVALPALPSRGIGGDCEVGNECGRVGCPECQQ